jgi:hypothetical protein
VSEHRRRSSSKWRSAAELTYGRGRRFSFAVLGTRQLSVSGYSPPEDAKPLGAYAVLTGIFLGGAAGVEAARRRAGWDLPDRVGLPDTVLLAVATYKLSRLVSKDRVLSFARAPFTRYTGEAGPSEVSEEPRGTGVRQAVGELLICPYCLGQWIAGVLLAGYIRDPAATRSVATLFAILAGSDVLNQGWVALQERA